MSSPAGPPKLTQVQLQLIQDLAAEWRSSDTWPLTNQMEARYKIEKKPRFGQTRDSIPDGLLGREESYESERTTLTIRGFATLPDGSHEVEPCVKLAQLAIARYIANPFDREEIFVTQDDMAAHLGASRAGELSRMGKLFCDFWRGSFQPDGTWKAESSMFDARLEGVTSVWELEQLRGHSEPDDQSAATAHPKILRAIYDYHREHGEWPPVAQIAIDLRREPYDVLGNIWRIDDEYLYPSQSNGTREQRLRLRLGGVALIAREDPDLERFAIILGALGDIYRDLLARGLRCDSIDAATAATKAGVTVETVSSVGEFFDGRHNTGSHWRDSSNDFQVSRPVMEWAGTRTFADYERRRDEERATQRAAEIAEARIIDPSFQEGEIEQIPAEDDAPLREFGTWRASAKLGEGGQAVAWIVRRSSGTAGRFVLKELKPWQPDGKAPSEAEQRARFAKEATTLMALSELGCPNIVRVVDTQLDPPPGAQPWYVMPYYEGGSMAKGAGVVGGIESYRGDVDRVLEIVRTIAVTLDWMHDHEPARVHRDVHTGNVFFEVHGGSPILGDFGLVHVADAQRELQTGAKEQFGPWQWRPPEFHAGSDDKHNPKSDVYLLGGIVYEALSGGETLQHCEFPDGTFQHEHPELSLARFCDPSRIEAINRLLRSMLARDPDLRPTAREVILRCAEIRRRISLPAASLNATGSAGAKLEQKADSSGAAVRSKHANRVRLEGVVARVEAMRKGSGQPHTGAVDLADGVWERTGAGAPNKWAGSSAFLVPTFDDELSFGLGVRGPFSPNGLVTNVPFGAIVDVWVRRLPSLAVGLRLDQRIVTQGRNNDELAFEHLP